MARREDEQPVDGEPAREAPRQERESEQEPLDLTESSALVFLSDSEERRLDLEAGAEPEGPTAPDRDASCDLSESTTYVFMSGSDVRRLDESLAGGRVSGRSEIGAENDRTLRGPRGASRARRFARGAKKRSAAVAFSLLIGWALSLWAFHAIDRRLWHAQDSGALRVAEIRRERDRAIARWKEAERRSKQALTALEERMERERTRLVERLREAERLAREREEELHALERVQTLERRDREREAFAAKQAVEAKIDRLVRERVARERLDLEHQIADTVRRYEALLLEAEQAQQRFVEVVRREARAEIMRREALLRKELEEERARFVAEQERERGAKAAEIEARLNEELGDAETLTFGGAEGADAEAGFLREADALFSGEGDLASEGVDLETEVWKHLRGHLSGQARYGFYGYFHGSEQPEAERRLDHGLIKLRYEVDLSEVWRLVVAPRLRLDDGGLSKKAQTGIVDDEPLRPIFSMEEVGIAAKWGELDLWVGEKIFSFGAADLFNPTDVLNPIDYTDLLDNEKIGMPALELTWWPGGGDTAVRAIWLPWFAPSRLPPAGERFFAVPSDVALPPIAERELPARTLGNGEVAFRVETRLSDVEVSLMTSYGFQRLPVLEPRSIAEAPFIELVPRYDRRLLLGADVSTEVRAFIVSAELAQTISEGDAQDDYLQYVFGVRRTWFPWERRLTLSLEYAGEWVNRQASAGALEVITDLARSFGASVLSRVRFEPVEDLELTVTGAWLFSGPDSWYVRPELRYRFGGHTQIGLGIDVLGGQQGGFFKRFDDEDRLFLDLKLSF